jgi:hypothetical protein
MGAMTLTSDLAATLQRVETTYQAAAHKAAERRDRAADTAAGVLEEAIRIHDETCLVADAEAATATSAARVAADQAIEEATAGYDEGMRVEVGAPAGTAIIEQGGALVLFDPRQRQPVAQASEVWGGHLRVTTPTGIAIVPDRLAARALLWESLRADTPAVV